MSKPWPALRSCLPGPSECRPQHSELCSKFQLLGYLKRDGHVSPSQTCLGWTARPLKKFFCAFSKGLTRGLNALTLLLIWGCLSYSASDKAGCLHKPEEWDHTHRRGAGSVPTAAPPSQAPVSLSGDSQSSGSSPVCQSDSESLSCSPSPGWALTMPANGSDGERRHSCEACLVSVFVKMERGTSLETLAGKGLILR